MFQQSNIADKKMNGGEKDLEMILFQTANHGETGF